MDRQIQVGLPTDIDLGKCDLLVGIADGNCMDSPEAPIRIKRYFAVKEITFFDELTGKLRLTYYNPKKTNVWLKIDAIEKVYFVDGVEE